MTDERLSLTLPPSEARLPLPDRTNSRRRDGDRPRSAKEWTYIEGTEDWNWCEAPDLRCGLGGPTGLWLGLWS